MRGNTKAKNDNAKQNKTFSARRTENKKNMNMFARKDAATQTHKANHTLVYIKHNRTDSRAFKHT